MTKYYHWRALALPRQHRDLVASYTTKRIRHLILIDLRSAVDNRTFHVEDRVNLGVGQGETRGFYDYAEGDA